MEEGAQVVSAAPARRALIVDGDQDTRDLYQAFLAPRRYDVEHATNGREAFAQAIDHPPDIIITETRLRDVDGYCLCELLRADRETQTVPIVVLTADARPSSLERARRAGADVVLTKPCLPEVLVREMDRARQQRTADGGHSPDRRRAGPAPATARNCK
jgi:CheY-like chemotaxis protein